MKKCFFFLAVIFNTSAFSLQVIRSSNSIQLAPGQSTIISLEIIKEKAEGVGKLLEEIPLGFSVQELNSGGGHFVREKGKLKIVWLTMPMGSQFKVSYKLINDAKVSGDYFVKGRFTFIENDIKKDKTISLLTVVIGTNGSVVAVAEKKSEKKVENRPVKKDVLPFATPEKKKVIEVKKSDEDVAVTQEKKKVIEVKKNDEVVPDVKLNSNPTNNPIDKPEVKSNGVIFKVQLGVYSSQKENSVFGDLPDIHFEKVNKLFKYFSGHFASEAEANAIVLKANKVGFKGAFLVKVKN